MGNNSSTRASNRTRPIDVFLEQRTAGSNATLQYSDSANNPNHDEPEDVLDLLDCSICLDLCSNRILQCKNGHNICAVHAEEIYSCPICRVSYFEGCSRNLLAEKMIANKQKLAKKNHPAVQPTPAARQITPDMRQITPAARQITPDIRQYLAEQQLAPVVRRSTPALRQSIPGGQVGPAGRIPTMSSSLLTYPSVNNRNFGTGQARTTQSRATSGSRAENNVASINPGTSRNAIFSTSSTSATTNRRSRRSKGRRRDNHEIQAASGSDRGSAHVVLPAGPSSLSARYIPIMDTLSTPASPRDQGSLLCFLKTDGCNNSNIPYSQFIDHLETVHNVKSYYANSHVNKYAVRRDNKLVRDGPTSVFILETLWGTTFIVRAKQFQGKVYIWVIYHEDEEDENSPYYFRIGIYPMKETVPTDDLSDDEYWIPSWSIDKISTYDPEGVPDSGLEISQEELRSKFLYKKAHRDYEERYWSVEVIIRLVE